MTFLVPRTSHEVSQLARIVNEANELSIALTRLAPNLLRLASSRLVAISDRSTNILSDYNTRKTVNTLAIMNRLELYTETKWAFKLAQTTAKCGYGE